MTLVYIISALAIIVQYAMLFLLGEILLHPEQIRHFVGLSRQDESAEKHRDVNAIIVAIGRCVQVAAVLGLLLALAGAFELLPRIS